MKSVEEISEIAAAANKIVVASEQVLIEKEVQRALELIEKTANEGKFSVPFAPNFGEYKTMAKILRGLGYSVTVERGSEYGGSCLWINIPKPKVKFDVKYPHAEVWFTAVLVAIISVMVAIIAINVFTVIAAGG